MRRSETACFTGHRVIAKKDLGTITYNVEQMTEALIRLGIKNFLCGGAIGFDTLAGFTVIELRERYPNVRLLLILPCRDQDAKWTPAQKATYRKLLCGADEIHYITDKYNDICMLQRNRYMIEHSLCCIAYLTRPYGGTAYTVRLAKEQNMVVHNLAELHLEPPKT